jgi:hypothetical protein
LYRIKPTLIDSYRVYKLEIFEKSLEDILKQIKGIYQPNEAMAFGTEVHRFLETYPQKEPMIFENLKPEEITQLVKIASQIPDGTNEIEIMHTIEDIIFDIRVDRISGKELHEFKTGTRFHGVDFYDNSLQWKVYLLATGGIKMTYHIITYSSKRPYDLKYHTPFYFYPYANMEAEIMEYAREFIDFCKIHNVEDYIKVK